MRDDELKNRTEEEIAPGLVLVRYDLPRRWHPLEVALACVLLGDLALVAWSAWTAMGRPLP
jgi:hypothetical protein